MDHNLLLTDTAVAATRGAAAAFVMKEYYGEDDRQDVRGPSNDEEDAPGFIRGKIGPNGKPNNGQQKVGIRPTPAQSYFLIS